MQIVMNVELVALVSLAASFLLLTKLHRQLSHMIEGRIYLERSQNWPVGVHAKYRASPKELMLHIASFGLLGIAIGLLVYLEQQLLPPLIVGALALVVFYLLTKEIRRNFPIEEARNRIFFEKQKR
ncbi:hypothetical protein L6Q21_11875 [Sandaracinobacter sp. RS1-74]|uniref:hypothetical protein n=1 Tax=Sandaracinobacteroides sayramensis TaxID=2913411 RepID=UPI001ED9E4D9|nr:hypothetical protein [Sandaracinobacteroides sayramensis]MCG2841679.1 hypothetical protein [Sandaracinobacteroides sayramensis]